jgi:capsular polysaccharide biosynthesis protein
MANTTFNGPVRSQNGFQSITTNATTGAVTVNSSFGTDVVLSTQSLSGAGAVDVTNAFTQLTTTGVAQALTLANGSVGEIKIISHAVDGGSAVLTPTTKIGFSTITFTAVGDSAMLIYTSAGWDIVALNGAVAA